MKAKAVIQNGIVQTMCRMCDTRCAIKVHIKDGIMVGISPDDHHPVNEGRMCARGAAAIDFFYHPDRLLKPLKKMPDGTFMEIPSEIGSVEAEAQIVHEKEILPDVLEMYHGWEDSRVNFVTYDHRNDPISGFPLLKAIPVRIEKIENKRRMNGELITP